MDLLRHRNGRTVVFAALYFSEGAPIGLVWWALPTLFRVDGVAVERITSLTAVLVLPWALKFLWAPLIDALRGPRWGYRAWIVATQVCMGLALIPLVWLDPAQDFAWWRGLLLIHAFTAATQDVAIDALAINVVPLEERGTLNGSMQAGMLVGRSAFGGGALLVATQLGREWILVALIVCIWSSLALLLASREPASVLSSKQTLPEFATRLREIGRRRSTWLALGFALIGAAAFESAGQLAGPFLVDRGVSQGTIGTFFGVAVVLATLAGGLVGGRLSDRWGRTRSVARFVIAFVALVGLLGAAELSGAAVSNTVILVLLTLLYFCIGLFTASSYALFMDLSDPRLGATHFSTFMAATNACESWSAWAGGRIAGAAGYGVSFLSLCVVSLLSIPLLSRLVVPRTPR